MISIFTIIRRTFIEPFLRENMGAFIFFYTVAILGVGHLDGQGVLYYHHSLIVGMLNNIDTFVIVCLFWLLYMYKCFSFVVRKLAKPENQFFYIFNSLSYIQRLAWCFFLISTLFVFIGWYALLIIGVAFYHHSYILLIVLVVYLVILCVVPAVGVLKRMKFPGLPDTRNFSLLKGLSGYPAVLLRYLLEQQKTVLITIKLVTCSLFYGFVRINDTTAYDVQFPYIFLSLGILANGVIIHRVRSFEEVYMILYRSYPVSLIRRFADYTIFYFFLLLPEIITIISVTPVHLHYDDAIYFATSAFGLVLLMNSICFLEDFSMNRYLKIILVILCFQFYFVISESIFVLSAIYLSLAAFIFFSSYYLFEKRPKPSNGL